MLKAQFLQFATMPTAAPYTVKSREKITSEGKGETKVLETATFFNNTLTSQALQDKFDQDFLENSGRNYRKTNALGTELPVFSYQTVLAKYEEASVKGFKTDQEVFEYLKDVFNIDLVQNVAYKDLFDSKGYVKRQQNPIFTKLALDSIKAVANNTLFKMKLETLMSQSKFDFIKNKARTNISTPLSSFVGDVPVAIASKIKDLPNTDPVKIYHKEHFYSAKPLNSERKNFYETIEKFYNVVNSASFLSAENKLEWSIREWNHLLHTVSILNSVDNVYELPESLNPNTYPFAKHSVWYNMLFDETGNRRLDNAGEKVMLEAANYSGYQFGEIGKKTTNLSGDTKMLQDLFSFLTDSTVENLRPGAKDSSFSVRISGNKQARTYFKPEDFINFDRTGALIPPWVTRTFQHYLLFEVTRMFQDKAKSTKREKLGSDFIILGNIIQSEDFKNALKEIAYSANSIEEMRANLYTLLLKSTI